MAAATPRLRIDSACRRLGQAEVVARCAGLLAGGDEASEFLIVLGGAPARELLASGLPEGQQYWLRVWAARGLLWAGTAGATEALRRGLLDEHWRVREMACKVVARHCDSDLLDEVVALEADANVRVARAATRAAQSIVSSGP